MMDLRGYYSELSKKDLSAELQCINALQRTPWRINSFVVETLRSAWESGEQWEGLPPRENLTPPPYPFDVPPQELPEDKIDQFKTFKAKRTSVHAFNAKSLSRRIQVERTIQLAEEYQQYENLWFVWQMDFRGRKYCVESFMSPQVADYGKACIEFANPAWIETDEDARWLAIHGANLFGVDKVSLDDREMFAYLHSDKAEAVADDPLTNRWWTEADKPWQALAWCKEWANYIALRRSGKPCETRLPCASDGSCNGLQHLSAMLRDSEGGRAVNLTPSSVPQDIYTDVAERTVELLEEARAQGDELAGQLLNIGIDRKVTKRSVMIVPYSGTRFACREYIKEALADKCTGNNPWDDQFGVPAHHLSGFVWEAISEVIVSAGKVMDYIKALAKLYADNKLHMVWTTPTDFLVAQLYKDKDKRRIRTHLDGNVIRMNYQKDKEGTTNKRKTVSGSAPNFIHSLDASALTLTVGKCLEEGITDFAMVHDSYGTHSPNMDRLNQHIREAFVEMYEENDVLEQLYEDAMAVLPEGTDVPRPPEKGDLLLREVIRSDYFFA